MNHRDSQKLIDDLVKDLSQVKSIPTPRTMVMQWAVLIYFAAIAIMLLKGPFRADWYQISLNHPRFTWELLLGLCLPVLGIVSLCLLVRPGRVSQKSWISWGPLIGLGLLTISLMYSLYTPAAEISMIGKRPWCFQETILISIPLFLAGLHFVRRGYPLRPALTGTILGLSSSLPVASLMHIACMYDPIHILQFHFSPVIAFIIIGATVLRLSK
ncbi:NrsF family protein [Pseudobacteriovorax antillogorgiicola]|uniref:DUF1109 domain-containing protein n=1 Tax=Pseudobacteriovorax antillogorgiicola TaxID=1513793 RepID=A0A1Y6CCH5_9BACT|nr:NrsF family protein [Pseudobacteriovorax antillogorgiicola]TCS48296.1 hypothetical protein EDD56_11876 [Pseudobacteriovorax antillogorgiicola]SMF56836.1 hypothetical protein SAMN06296036_11865 [Pseudobacteriovorax antillogorgiicola]